MALDELEADAGEDIVRRLEQGEGLTGSPSMKYVLAGRAWRRRWRCICPAEVVDSAHTGTHRANREWNVHSGERVGTQPLMISGREDGA